MKNNKKKNIIWNHSQGSQATEGRAALALCFNLAGENNLQNKWKTAAEFILTSTEEVTGVHLCLSAGLLMSSELGHEPQKNQIRSLSWSGLLYYDYDFFPLMQSGVCCCSVLSDWPQSLRFFFFLSEQTIWAASSGKCDEYKTIWFSEWKWITGKGLKWL